GTSHPTEKQLAQYLSVLGVGSVAASFAKLHAGRSRLSRICEVDHARTAPPAQQDWVRLASLEREDLDWFAGREDLELASAPTGKAGIARYVLLSPELMALLGVSASYEGGAEPYGLSFRCPRATAAELKELSAALAAVFGLPPESCEYEPARS